MSTIELGYHDDLGYLTMCKISKKPTRWTVCADNEPWVGQVLKLGKNEWHAATQVSASDDGPAAIGEYKSLMAGADAILDLYCSKP